MTRSCSCLQTNAYVSEDDRLHAQAIKYAEEKAYAKTFLKEDVNKALYTVHRALILNAWRKTRRGTHEFKLKSEQLRNNATNLRAQVLVLREMLEGELDRTERTCRMVRHLTQLSTDNLKARIEAEEVNDSQLEEIEMMDAQICRWKEYSLNQLNALFHYQKECKVLEKALDREHGKLLKLREQNKTLLTQVDEYEETIRVQRDRIAELEASIQCKPQVQTLSVEEQVPGMSKDGAILANESQFVTKTQTAILSPAEEVIEKSQDGARADLKFDTQTALLSLANEELETPQFSAMRNIKFVTQTVILSSANEDFEMPQFSAMQDPMFETHTVILAAAEEVIKTLPDVPELAETHHLTLKIKALETAVKKLHVQNKSLGGTQQVNNQQIADLPKMLDEPRLLVHTSWLRRMVCMASSVACFPYEIISFIQARGVAAVFPNNSSS